jgi:hypothetical protein
MAVYVISQAKDDGRRRRRELLPCDESPKEIRNLVKRTLRGCFSK